MKILHVAAELFPWVKVGGLGDVLAALPQALRELGMDVGLLAPGYPALMEAAGPWHPLAEFPNLLGGGAHRLVRTQLPNHPRVYLIEGPFFDRPGNPYAEQGDSHRRFAALAWVAAWLGQRGEGDWVPQVLHLHDWQTALAPAYLTQAQGPKPRTVMTVHNLAYQGVYDPTFLDSLELPRSLFHMHGLEFHGALNFLKGGLQFADRISTVSPTYAREIQTPHFGEGLDGLLAHRAADLRGILNGIDQKVWDPAHSPHLPAHYDRKHPLGKSKVKASLQSELGLEVAADRPLLGLVTRLASQKGLDLVLENLEHLLNLGAQLALLGTGDPALEQGFLDAAARHPGRIAVKLAYHEALSHRIIAGSDLFLVPSRFEPCGLTQLYALRYGTLPLVRRTGGLADTVVDAWPESIATGQATGFSFNAATGWELGQALDRAVRLYREDTPTWVRLRRTAMAQDFGWGASALRYQALYQELVG